MEKLQRVYKEQKEKIDRLDEMVKKLMNDSKRKKSDESSYNYVNFSENNITNEIKEYDEKQNISEKSSLNIFEDLFKTIEDDNSKEQIKKIDENIINKFSGFLMKNGKNNYNNNLIIPPHKLSEDELNILNEFMDELSYGELENISDFDCNCKFCGTCKLKLTLKNMMK